MGRRRTEVNTKESVFEAAQKIILDLGQAIKLTKLNELSYEEKQILVSLNN